jgi:DNA-binding transcriptional ArsR family regulator
MLPTRPPRLSVPEATCLFHLMGEATRLGLLALLEDRGEPSVGDLVEASGRPQSTVSNHLSLLHRGGVVDCRREGKHLYYRLHSPQAHRGGSSPG